MLLVAGCGNRFDPEYAVVTPRLLAVKAEPPEIGAGETTHLSSLTFDPMGRAIAVSWKLCTLAPSTAESTPVNGACITGDTDLGDYLVDLGTGDAIDFVAPKVDVRNLGVPDVSGGLYLPIVVRIAAGPDAADTDVGVYGLRYSYAPIPRNHNPTITDVLEVTTVGGGDAGPEVAMPLAPMREVHDKDSLILRTDYPMGAAEPYFRLSGVPPMVTMDTERLTQSWFVTAGAPDGGELPENDPYMKLTIANPGAMMAGPMLPPSGAPIDLWVVLRDNRGGIDWAHRQVVFR